MSRILLLITHFLVFFLLNSTALFCQNNIIDSLKVEIEKEDDLEKKVLLLNDLASEFQSIDYKKALKCGVQAYTLSTQIKSSETKIKALVSQSANNAGGGYLLLDDYENALKYLLIALETAEEIQDTSRMSNAAYNLSIVYDYKGNKSLSVRYLERSINLDELSGNLASAAYGYSSLSADYFFKPDYNKGMVYYTKAMDIATRINNEELIGILYENRAVGLKYEGRFIEALKYHEKSIAIDKKYNNLASLKTNYLNVADLYFEMNKYSDAINYNNKSLKIAIEENSVKTIMKAYSGLADCYEQLGNRTKAYEAIKLYANWKDSLYMQENSSAMAEMQTKYDTEKKEAENTLLIAEKKLDKAKLEKKSVQQKLLLALLGLVMLIVAYVVYSLNQKKKTNKLLNAQNEEIVSKNEIIEEKNKDITDSINYAQKIQDAILPDEVILKNNFESFVYYLPKDIVSGDFYWFKEIGDKFFFSVVDCTGHGVPGAFMSIIGANSLNKIVEDLKIETPGEILDELNKLVNVALGVKEDNKRHIIRDGMDISICVINKSTNELLYAGANNPLYLLRNSGVSLDGLKPILNNDKTSFYEIKANKMAIGGGSNTNNYKTHKISLEKNDTIYLFSDGYADQFGGPKGKKFMYKPFKRMFLSIQDKNMEEQTEYIRSVMNDWKGNLEQLDDICIMGIRINS